MGDQNGQMNLGQVFGQLSRQFGSGPMSSNPSPMGTQNMLGAIGQGNATGADLTKMLNSQGGGGTSPMGASRFSGGGGGGMGGGGNK